MPQACPNVVTTPTKRPKASVFGIPGCPLLQCSAAEYWHQTVFPSQEGPFLCYARCETLTEGGQPWRSSKFACPTYRVNRRGMSSSQSSFCTSTPNTKDP